MCVCDVCMGGMYECVICMYVCMHAPVCARNVCMAGMCGWYVCMCIYMMYAWVVYMILCMGNEYM